MTPRHARGRTHGRSLREGTARGRRYVANGRVRIEWQEDGRRRRKTIGPDSAEMRRRADNTLRAILRRLSKAESATVQDRQTAGPASAPRSPLRALMLTTLDTADGIADWIAAAIGLKEVR